MSNIRNGQEACNTMIQILQKMEAIGSTTTGGSEYLHQSVQSSHVLVSTLSYLYQLAAVKSSKVLHVCAGDESYVDFSNIYLARETGLVFICSSSVQEAHDLALIAQWVSLLTCTPCLHFFDSKQIAYTHASIQLLDDPLQFLSEEMLHSSEEPLNVYQTLEHVMSQFAKKTERSYAPLEYTGHPQAISIIVAMGAGATIVEDVLKAIFREDPERKVGVIKIRLLRPWSHQHFLKVLPSFVQQMAVLEAVPTNDSTWNPLFQDIAATLQTVGNEEMDLFSGQYGVDDVDISPDIVNAIYNGLDTHNIQRHFKVSSLPNTKTATDPSTVEPMMIDQSTDDAVQIDHRELSVELPYINILKQVFGRHLNIPNALQQSDTTLEMGYGRFVNYTQDRFRFVHSVIDTIRDATTSCEALCILSHWLLLVNSPHATMDQINEAADLVVPILSHFSHLVKQQHLLYQTAHWLIGSDDTNHEGLNYLFKCNNNINVLLIDTAPYSVKNEKRKKDIGLYAMHHGSIYVASVAVYYSYTGVLEALKEANAYRGPSIVIAYLPQLQGGSFASLKETKQCVDNGSWPLYRWNPRNNERERFLLDSPRMKHDLQAFLTKTNQLTQVVLNPPNLSQTMYQSLENDILNRHVEMKEKSRTEYARLLSGFGAMQRDIPLTILYGSDNGNAETVAKKTALHATIRGIQVKLMIMDDYDLSDLTNETNVIILTSTAGQGEMPSNARLFWKSLNGYVKGDVDLSEVRLSIFGLGDSNYWGNRKDDDVFYNRPARLLDAKFEVLGATRLVALGLADDQDADGYETGWHAWVPDLWKALGLDKDVAVEAVPIYTDEQMKLDSNYLRGSIAQDLVDTTTETVSKTSQKLLTFHGVQQDESEGFSIHVRTPGGMISPKQWLSLETLSVKYGKKSLQLTTRQSIQLDGIPKKNLRSTIRAINKSLFTTLGTCGDISQNIMCSPVTDEPEVHAQLQATALELDRLLLPQTKAYYEIWLDNSMVPKQALQDVEPVYGPTYLPYKFNIAITTHANHHIDIDAQDVSYMARVDPETKKIQGYNVWIGGGKEVSSEHHRAASLIGYISAEYIAEVTRAIVILHRDHSERINRQQAPFMYTVEKLGLDFIKNAIEEESKVLFETAQSCSFQEIPYHDGWTRGANDTWHYSLWIPNGHVVDREDFMCKTALKELARFHKGNYQLISHQHIVLCNIPASDLERTKNHLQKYHLNTFNK